MTPTTARLVSFLHMPRGVPSKKSSGDFHGDQLATCEARKDVWVVLAEDFGVSNRETCGVNFVS